MTNMTAKMMADINEGNLTVTGAIGSEAIPDVTIEGGNFMMAARHLVDETGEVRQELNRYYQMLADGASGGELLRQEHKVLCETIDVCIMGLSAVEKARQERGEMNIATTLLGVLAKNADRGYYSTESPLHVRDLKSGSAQRYRMEQDGRDGAQGA